MPKNNSSPKPKKFRLVLDSAFARASIFPRLKKKANVVHIVHDLGLPFQAEDEEIYLIAAREERFVVTINYKDFKKLVKPKRSGVLSIPAYLSNEQIDSLIVEFISGKNPDDYWGKIVKLFLD